MACPCGLNEPCPQITVCYSRVWPCHGSNGFARTTAVGCSLKPTPDPELSSHSAPGVRLGMPGYVLGNIACAPPASRRISISCLCIPPPLPPSPPPTMCVHPGPQRDDAFLERLAALLVSRIPGAVACSGKNVRALRRVRNYLASPSPPSPPYASYLISADGCSSSFPL